MNGPQLSVPCPPGCQRWLPSAASAVQRGCQHACFLERSDICVGIFLGVLENMSSPHPATRRCPCYEIPDIGLPAIFTGCSVSRPFRRPEDAEQKTREPLGLKSLPGPCPSSPCSEGTLSPGSGAGRFLQRRVEGSLSSTRGSEGPPWVYKPSPSHAVTASSIGPHTRVTGYGRGRASV